MSFPRAARNPRRSPLRARARRPGLTLIEILISTAVTLIMIFAIVEIFERVGTAVAQGRAAMEMSGQIRGAAHRLREDIRAVTVPVRPWPRSSAAEGYFEIFEGAGRDFSFLPPNAPHPTFSTMRGDVDDVVAFTARSVDEPFVGRFGGQAIESQVAEIIWWTIADSIGNVSLHRRVLLVRPDLTVNWVFNGPTPRDDMRNFYNDNDVSVRFVPNNAGLAIGLVANSLADLTKRENRFAHVTLDSFPFGVFPFPMDVMTPANPMSLVNLGQFGLHQGDDLILSHLQAFDVRVFDPSAPIRTDGNRSLIPSDPGWWQAPANSTPQIGAGAFVDLAYNPGQNSVFSNLPNVLSQLHGLDPASVYDTWSFHYEHDGNDQDWSAIAASRPIPAETWRQTVDQGTNGLDDNNSNGPDDVYERETSPPYPVPLRGIQIKIRIDDPDSRQVREATVVNEFIPE